MVAAIAGNHDWSLIPEDLLVLILRLLPLPDLIRSRSVCSSWLLALKSSPKKAISPILMLAGDVSDEVSEHRTFLFLSDPARPYRPRLPQISGRRCLASADGWILTVDELAELHLFNPFTFAERPLPSITTLSSVVRSVERDAVDGRITGYMLQSTDAAYLHDLEHMLHYFFARGVIFSSSPVEKEKEKEIVVFIIYGERLDLAFVRPGDAGWTQLQFPRLLTYFFNDVVFHKGQYYAVQVGGVCIAFDISSSTPDVTFVGPPNHGGTVQRYHLVESSDGDYLLEIWRHDNWVQPDGDYDGVPNKYGLVYKTQAFTVFKLDTSSGTAAKMVKVESLEEGTALFLGDNRSMLLNTRDLPELKENCIYFTDGETEQYLSERHMRRDVGVYDMKEKTIQPLYPRESVLNRLTWPPPVWLMPCFPSV